APGKPGSLARPNELPGSDLTSAFDQQQPVAGGASPAAVGTFAYGFQVHMWDISQEARGYVVGDVKQAGFNWAKHQIEWTAIEPTPSQYDWSELDTIINTDVGAGLNVLVSVQHAPEFDR